MSGLYPCEWRTSGLSSPIVRRSARTTPGSGARSDADGHDLESHVRSPRLKRRLRGAGVANAANERNVAGPLLLTR